MVKWYYVSFPNLSWEFDSPYPYQNINKMNIISPFRILIFGNEKWWDVDYVNDFKSACEIASMFVDTHGENFVQMRNAHNEILA